MTSPNAPLDPAPLFEGAARAPVTKRMEDAGCGTTPVMASPVVLSRAVMDSAVGHCQAIRWATLELLRRWRAGDPLLRGAVVLPQGLDTVLEDHDVALMQRCRFDAIVDATGQFHLLELQVGDPSGAAWSDVLVAAMPEAPGFKAWTRTRRVGAREIVARHAMLLKSQGAKKVGVLCDPQMFAIGDARHHARLLAHHGLTVTPVTDPRDVEVDGGRVRVAGLQVDTALRDSVDDFLSPPFFSRTTALRAALRHGAVRLHNPFWDALLDDKGWMEWLHQHGVPGVPCSRLVWERKTTWKGLEVDLVAALSRDREGTVLKPRDGYGGHGVVLGRDCTQAAWDDALATALRHAPRFLAQAYVETPRVNVVDATGVLRQPFVTLSIWLVAGQDAGAFARVGDRRVTNVHSGGGMAAVYVDEGPV
jgi:uncharacterized circularly permuted ATP-grasp superfamily protein